MFIAVSHKVVVVPVFNFLILASIWLSEKEYRLKQLPKNCRININNLFFYQFCTFIFVRDWTEIVAI